MQDASPREIIALRYDSFGFSIPPDRYILRNLQKYTITRTPEATCPITVAHAAPLIPHPNPKINSGSRIVLMIAPIIMQTIE